MSTVDWTTFNQNFSQNRYSRAILSALSSYQANLQNYKKFYTHFRHTLQIKRDIFI